MEKLVIEIKTANAAFQDGMIGHEISRILKGLAEDILNDGNLESFVILRDINGNSVGFASYEQEE